MTRRILLIFAPILLLFSVGAAQIPQQYIWKITFIADSVGSSKISVQNRCRDEHDFSITGQNVPFLTFASSRVKVKGAESENVPVTVNTDKLRRRSYQGQVTLFCLTCSREPGCGQSRDILNVTLNVVTREELAEYKPSKEIGIDSPIAISSGVPRNGASPRGASEEEVMKLLESLSGNSASSASGTRPASACGVPQLRVRESAEVKNCKGNCAEKQKALKDLQDRVRLQTERAEKFCLGLIQLENTTAFVEARASRAERQLSDSIGKDADARVVSSLRAEAENSRKDARVFREKLEAARLIVDEAKERAFALMQEMEDAGAAFDDCVRLNPSDCK